MKYERERGRRDPIFCWCVLCVFDVNSRMDDDDKATDGWDGRSLL